MDKLQYNNNFPYEFRDRQSVISNYIRYYILLCKIMTVEPVSLKSHFFSILALVSSNDSNLLASLFLLYYFLTKQTMKKDNFHCFSLLAGFCLFLGPLYSETSWKTVLWSQSHICPLFSLKPTPSRLFSCLSLKLFLPVISDFHVAKSKSLFLVFLSIGFPEEPDKLDHTLS